LVGWCFESAKREFGVIKILWALVGLSILLSGESYSRSNCSEIWNRIISKKGLDARYRHLNGLCGEEFRKALKDTVDDQQSLDYYAARLAMFAEVDNNDGEVCGVYSGKCIITTTIPDQKVMNCEHSWPQSKGAKGIAKSDLHHLFPVIPVINSRRNNFPFCEVQSTDWEEYGSKLGRSSYGTKCFEPRVSHHGDLARAMFYFAVRYSFNVDSEQELYFRKWNLEDQVSEKESERNDRIDAVQGNRNPFVDYPEFVELILNF